MSQRVDLFSFVHCNAVNVRPRLGRCLGQGVFCGGVHVVGLIIWFFRSISNCFVMRGRVNQTVRFYYYLNLC